MEKQRERLIDLLNRHCALRQENNDCTNETTEDCSTCLADFLLANGVIVPPCKVGDKVYTLFYKNIDEGAVVSCEYSRASGFSYMSSNGKFPTLFDERNIGKTVFFTKEEAEAALKGGEG